MTRLYEPPAFCALGLVSALFLIFVCPDRLSADESDLTVADLAAYRAALSGKATKTETGTEQGRAGATADSAPLLGFRALWDHRATYVGRRVWVEGVPRRRFRQGAYGTFPPIEEVWVFTHAGDPFCLVFPVPSAAEERPAKSKAAAPDGPVRFVGTFLKLVRYQGADGPRLAPLIVGPAPPIAWAALPPSNNIPSPSPATDVQRMRLDGWVGLGAAVLVALVLAVQHMRRPSRRVSGALLDRTPAPLFDDAATPPPRPGS